MAFQATDTGILPAYRDVDARETRGAGFCWARFGWALRGRALRGRVFVWWCWDGRIVARSESGISACRKQVIRVHPRIDLVE